MVEGDVVGVHASGVGFLLSEGLVLQRGRVGDHRLQSEPQVASQMGPFLARHINFSRVIANSVTQLEQIVEDAGIRVFVVEAVWINIQLLALVEGAFQEASGLFDILCL